MALTILSEGNLNNLLLEGRTLQNHLPKSNTSKNGDGNIARTFSNLMFQGTPVLYFSYSLREAIGVSYMLMIKVTLHHNQFLFSPHSQGLVQGDLKNTRKANEKMHNYKE